VAIYDVLKAAKVNDLVQVYLDEEVKKRNKTVTFPIGSMSISKLK
jgi:hypothetical protein